MRLPWRTVDLILPLFLVITTWGCTPKLSPCLPDETMPQDPFHETVWSPEDPRLVHALSVYQQGNFPEARLAFLRVALETDTMNDRELAMLGAILSGLLSARDVDEVQIHLDEFERLASGLGTGEVLLDPDLLRPLLQTVLEVQEGRQKVQKLRTESETKSRRISSLQDETAKLKQQVEELEALFQLLEQQKRQPIVPGVIN